MSRGRAWRASIVKKWRWSVDSEGSIALVKFMAGAEALAEKGLADALEALR